MSARASSSKGAQSHPVVGEGDVWVDEPLELLLHAARRQLTLALLPARRRAALRRRRRRRRRRQVVARLAAVQRRPATTRHTWTTAQRHDATDDVTAPTMLQYRRRSSTQVTPQHTSQYLIRRVFRYSYNPQSLHIEFNPQSMLNLCSALFSKPQTDLFRALTKGNWLKQPRT